MIWPRTEARHPRPPTDALADLRADVAALTVHAVDSPAYRDGANSALAAVLELIDQHAAAHHAVAAALCAFPGCDLLALADTGRCVAHTRVTISGSYVNDRHADGGHG